MGAANISMVDKAGVLHSDHSDLHDMNRDLATQGAARTLEQAMRGADVFIGVSAANALAPGLLKLMAANPIVFALANPDPEILPDVAFAVRDDLIMATGRSDFPNQVNNALCFPFLFRGALDARARQITTAMQIAAAKALAELAREPVPDAVLSAYTLTELSFGKHYIIPKPFDPRLIERIPPRVAEAWLREG